MSKNRYTSPTDLLAMLKAQNYICADKDCDTILVLGPKGQRVNFIVEHRLALGRGGNNKLENKDCRCIACGNKKTHHPRSKATTLGGDNYEAKKTDRLSQKVAGTWHAGKPKRKIPSRKLQSGRKIPSRDWDKR